MQQPSTSGRPLGVTILTILAGIYGVFGLVTSLPLLGGGLFGFIDLLLAIVAVVFAYGAWMLQPWGWTLGVGFAPAGIVWAMLRLTQGADVVRMVIGIVISGVILYYLFQPEVKAAFGRT